MEAAVIDRIRGYADDGMSPERIASTLAVPLPDVRRHLVGMATPEPRHARQPGTVDVGPLVALPVSAPKKAPTPPPFVPIRGDGKPTDKQRAIWALVVDEGLSRVEAAERLGILAPSVRNQLIAYMEHMGIGGPIPGKVGNTGPRRREPAALPLHEDLESSHQAAPPTTKGPVANTHQTHVLSASDVAPPDLLARLDDAIARNLAEAERLHIAREVLVSLA